MGSRFGAPAVAVLLLALGPALAAPENHGRTIQPNEVVTTTITPAEDVDDFVFDAATGWKVSASARGLGGGDLAPVLELVAPGGTLVTAGVTVKASGSSAKLTATLAEGGRFALRLRGSSGTGGCTLKWKLSPGKILPVKDRSLAADSVTPFTFPARGGALVSWSFRFKGDGGAQVSRVTDPDGVDAGFDPADTNRVKRRATSEVVKDFPLPDGGPGGLYALVVENKFAPVVGSLSVTVKLPKVPVVSVTLTAAEPVLLSLSSITGGCFAPVTLTGVNLSASPRGVLFGAAAATGVQWTDSTSVVCRAPSGTGTVDVVFVAADGQEAALAAAYSFQPPPTLLSFDPAVGPGVGGVPVTLRGAGLRDTVANLYKVLVGGVPASQVRVLDTETITFVTPANVAGPKDVVLRDTCGVEVKAPGTFTYGTGLFITTVRPEAVPVFGGVAVLVSGANFLASDLVYLDGKVVPTTNLLYQGTVIGHLIEAANMPAHAPGKVDVKVQSTAPGGVSATKTGAVAYFTFTDVTATAIPAASSTDDWGGVSSALADGDGDGRMDMLLITQPAALSSTRPGTRLLRGNASGVFTDATATGLPSPTSTESFGGNAVLAGRLNNDNYPDVYLSRAGSGIAWDKPPTNGTPDWNEARMLTGGKFVNPWSMLLFADASGTFTAPTQSGPLGLLAISGFIICNASWGCGQQGVDNSRPGFCRLYDFDFRSVNAAMGDLDGDFDQDIVLVNDASLADFTGTSIGTWGSCYGYSQVDYQYYTVLSYGHATRILATGSNGGQTDRTEKFMETLATKDEDFRAVGANVADMTGDFLNDILIVHNKPILKSGNPVAAARLLYQKNSGSSVTFKQNAQFFPAVSSGSDDWRGDAITGSDLNGDFYRDVVVSLNAAPVGSSAFSSRILVSDSSSSRLVDRTSAILSGVLPAGDDGRALVVLAKDIDRDTDIDLILSTPDPVGTGNRRTRFLLNIGADEVTGLPRFLDASSLFPAESSDPGNAVSVAVGDIDGDGDNDIVLTDTHQTSGTPVKRTRVWRQDR